MATAKKTPAIKTPAKKVAAVPTPAAKAPAKPVASKTVVAKKVAAKKTRPGSRGDAVALLTKDHKDVKQLFRAYAKLVKADAGDEEKQSVAKQICMLLTVHATIEEEIFYPAMREQLSDADLVDEAQVEHASAKDLIAQIQSMQPGDDLYDAKVSVLGEYIEHHVQEEEGEMFPKAVKAKADLAGLGAQLKARKEELMSAESSTV